jgi:hypothetical protein
MGAAAKQDDVCRCIGCGKAIEGGTTFRILAGVTRDGEFEEKSEYGDVHEDCFHRAVETPRSVLDTVRRRARKSGKQLRRE